MITVAELDERIERCLAILADNPHSQVFAALAEAYRRRGEFGRAFAVCKSGLKHHPNYAPAHVVMAKLYLHQKMHSDAMASLRKAVENDGATRATDFLEAELYLDMGEFASAEPIIERLRRSERRNPAVVDLVTRLKELRSQERAQLAADHGLDAGDDRIDEPAPVNTAMPETLTWEQWGRQVRTLTGVQSAFAYDAASHVVYPLDTSTTGNNQVTVFLDAFRDIDEQLNGTRSGPLSELRIETDICNLWCGRVAGMVIGLIGDSRMSYGEARRLAQDWYARVDQSRTEDNSQTAGSPIQ